MGLGWVGFGPFRESGAHGHSTSFHQIQLSPLPRMSSLKARWSDGSLQNTPRCMRVGETAVPVCVPGLATCSHLCMRAAARKACGWGQEAGGGGGYSTSCGCTRVVAQCPLSG